MRKPKTLEQIIYTTLLALLVIILWVDFFDDKSVSGRMFNDSISYFALKLLIWLAIIQGLINAFGVRGKPVSKFLLAYGVVLIVISLTGYVATFNREAVSFAILEPSVYTSLFLVAMYLVFNQWSNSET